MTSGDVPLDTTKLRRFIEHCPKNAVMVYTTGWHVMAAEMMRRMLVVIEKAERFTDDDYLECMGSRSRGEVEALSVAIGSLRATLNKQKEPTKCDSPS